jgi:hypothetical protein
MSFKPWTFDYRGAGVEAYVREASGIWMNVLMWYASLLSQEKNSA